MLKRLGAWIVWSTVLLETAVLGSTAAASPFGIAAHIPKPRMMDEMSAAGIAWVRIDFVWSLVEIERDVFVWQVYDDLVDGLEARGIKIFATLAGTPEWATEGPLFSGAPSNPEDWREFCYRAASRYRGRIHAWGFWNEPNLDRFWDGSRTQYIREILIPGAEAVRAADPQALRCGADLAHLQSGDWDDWLERVIYDADYLLNVITHHVYPSDGSAGDVTALLDESPQYPWDPPAVRQVLEDTGWRGRPFWLTETGVESNEHGEAGQASFYGNLLEEWYGPDLDNSWLDRIFFYELFDPPHLPDETWGILEAPPELSRKPAFDAYRDFIASAQVDDADIEPVELPAFVEPLASYSLTVRIHNTGTTNWSASDYRLRVEMVDAVGWQASGGELEPDAIVAPGDTVELELALATPYWSEQRPPGSGILAARMQRQAQWLFGGDLRHTMTISTRQPPRIVAHPEAAVVAPHGGITLSVAVESPTAVGYQWRRNSLALSDDLRLQGTASSELTLSDVNLDLLGDYDCVITNEGGSVVSRPAAVELVDRVRRAPPARVTPGGELWIQWLNHRYQRRVSPPPPADRFESGESDRRYLRPVSFLF